MKRMTVKELVKVIEAQGFYVKGNGDGTVKLLPHNELGIRYL